MINIICIGNLKEKYLKEAEAEYLKRLESYSKINLIEISEAPTLIKEADKIKSKLKGNKYNILLDINGETYTSEEFSNKLSTLMATVSKDIVFIIGSSNGVSEEIRKLADLKISFSKLTFPHQLFRIMFLEQLYRNFKIMKNEPYHK